MDAMIVDCLKVERLRADCLLTFNLDGGEIEGRGKMDVEDDDIEVD